MRFYPQQHKHYCGIDLHARTMYVCLLDQAGTILVHKNVAATPEAFLRVIDPSREDMVVAVAVTSCASGQSYSPISSTPTASTTYRCSAENWHTKAIEKELRSASLIPVCVRASKLISR